MIDSPIILYSNDENKKSDPGREHMDEIGERWAEMHKNNSLVGKKVSLSDYLNTTQH